MLVLAQRWCCGTPSTDFGKQVVEALVFLKGEGCAYDVYSAFYDPAAGEDLAKSFLWWHRGISGLMPHVITHAMNILSNWSLPPEEGTSLQTYVHRMETLVGHMQRCCPS